MLTFLIRWNYQIRIFVKLQSSFQLHSIPFNLIIIFVPWPIEDSSTFISPLWYSSIILLASDRPNPQPLSFVVIPGLKILFLIDLFIPTPLSEMNIFTYPSAFETLMLTLPFSLYYFLVDSILWSYSGRTEQLYVWKIILRNI